MAFYKGNPDVIIKNGKIIDGSGVQGYYADVALKGDKIDYIGNLQDVDAPLVIDATGKVVTPGFIDVHTHSDQNIWVNPEAQSSVRQGVTTEIVGNCGMSMRHQNDVKNFDEKGKDITCVYDLVGKNDVPKGAMAAVLDKYDAMGGSLNLAWLCGHNDLRVIAGVHTEKATDEQFKVMADFLREAMDAGFVGFSTGLEFDPGILCKPEEVERLAQIVAEYDANYSTHMRDEGTYIIEAVEEFLNVIRKSGLRGTISHLNVKYDNGIPNEYLFKSMQMLKDARENEHLNVYADMLPTCFSTGGVQAMLPPWLYADGWDKAKEILATEEGREKVKGDMNRYWRFLASGQWDRLLKVLPPYMPEVSKKSFADVVKEWGKEPVDCFLDIVAAAPSIEDLRGTCMIGLQFKEDIMVDSVIKDPIYLWETDGFTSTTEGCAKSNNMQNYMSTAYYLVRYVRELKAISLEAAVNKMTYRAAQHFKLDKRGLLAEGYYADINVFGLEDIKINATFNDPAKYSTGMKAVIVNGTPVVIDDEHTHARPGRALRHLPKN